MDTLKKLIEYLTQVSNTSMKNCGLKLETYRSITKNVDGFDEKYMIIKIDSHGNLPLNKTIEIPIVTITIRAVFYENKKYYPQAFLDECLYKI